MKIRNGFVSNSSTSSFCIYGAYIKDKEALVKRCQKILNEEEEEDVDFYGIVEEAAGKFGLGFWSISGESYYVGNSWCNIKDDQTGKQFKEEIAKAVKELVGDEAKCETHQEAWYN